MQKRISVHFFRDFCDWQFPVPAMVLKSSVQQGLWKPIKELLGES